MSSDEEVEQCLCTIRRCFIYKIPPRTSGMGYRAAGWNNQIWFGKLQVMLRGSNCVVEFVDEDDNLFATATIRDDGPSAVESVLDSSRYFVVRIEKNKKKAYVGLGFQERSEALDFKIALQEYKKYIEEPEEEDEDGEEADFTLGDGETLHRRNHRKAVENNIDVNSQGGIAPPPQEGRTRRRGRTGAAKPKKAAAAASDDLADMSAPAAPAAAPVDDIFNMF
ncbi:hypothetical protein WA158_000972 [Blastocystis sp. Blastoise]